MKRWSKMAKTFTRIGKDIVMAVKDGGPNPETNARLRQVIQNAKAANMPKDNVDRKGVFTIDPIQVEMELEELEMELIDGGLEDLEQDEEAITAYTEYADFSNMQKQLEKLSIEVKNAELQRFPNNMKTLDAEKAALVLKLLDKLEDDDDVQNVFHNMEMTEEVLAVMEAE